MKRTVVSALVLVMFGLGSTALAAPKGPKGPPAKAEILHCGCAMTPAGLGMEYKLISVSSRAKGHAKHVSGSIDSCSGDGINYYDFVRTGDDCQVSGPAVSGLDACTTEQPFDACGVAMTPP
jgi:hypothetical protein